MGLFWFPLLMSLSFLDFSLTVAIFSSPGYADIPLWGQPVKDDFHSGVIHLSPLLDELDAEIFRLFHQVRISRPHPPESFPGLGCQTLPE